MPPLPPAPNVLRVAINGTIGATDWSNIFHWVSSAALGVLDVQEMANTAGASYNTRIMPNVAAYFATAHTLVEDLSASPLPAAIYGTGVAGGQTLGSAVASACQLVKHTIPRRYRGGHPRTYLPGADSQHMADADRWSPGQVTGMQSAFSAFLNDVNTHAFASGNTFDYVNVSYFSGGVLRVAPVIDFVGASSMEAAIASQRRRFGR